MSSTFTGFSEEDLKRLKADTTSASGLEIANAPAKVSKIGVKQKRPLNQYKLPVLQTQDSNENLERIFEKCKLSLSTPTPTSPPENTMNNLKTFEENKMNANVIELPEDKSSEDEESTGHSICNRKYSMTSQNSTNSFATIESRKNSVGPDGNRRSSSVTPPDIVRCIDNFTEDDLAAHQAKLADLQLQQKLMEEQNKKRKEMLARALADRTKQTEEEVMRLEKIKKELEVVDSQFSQDVALLRRNIDHACLQYADAEKNYFKVEKEFLQAKINLQKAKDKKELLIEHLCTLITHNETRKAQKLESLMLELSANKKIDVTSEKNDENSSPVDETNVKSSSLDDDDEKPVVIDGVDERTVSDSDKIKKTKVLGTNTNENLKSKTLGEI